MDTVTLEFKTFHQIWRILSLHSIQRKILDCMHGSWANALEGIRAYISHMNFTIHVMWQSSVNYVGVILILFS
jgi:hypothetical protein